ncbi:MAG: pilus assembly protein TadG-related protein, partial [Actinomycetota bacterium]|nr:pilus assembly protein TadG-related protein [Actinomycetota bacterium]
MLTRLLRKRRPQGEAGAAAIVLVCGLASGVLFGLGALAVDLGNAYARKRATRTAADLVALAGAQGLPDMVKARTMALNYLGKNPVQGGVDYGS